MQIIEQASQQYSTVSSLQPGEIFMAHGHHYVLTRITCEDKWLVGINLSDGSRNAFSPSFQTIPRPDLVLTTRDNLKSL